MKHYIAILLLLILGACHSETTDNKNRIIGNWVGEIIIPKTGKSVGKMYLEFTENGALFQKTGEGKEQVTSKVLYRINKDKIFYKGAITGNEELSSNYYFNGDVLVMEVNGESTNYTRIKN